MKGMRSIVVLYGSETGNAQDAAERLGREANSLGFHTRVLPANSYMKTIDTLPSEDILIAIVSTTGQGEFPRNFSSFWKFLRKKSLGPDSLRGVSCAVFGLGDSGYPKYNYSAKLVHKRLQTLGATPMVPLGLGDDQHAFGYDAAFDLWLDRLWSSLDVSRGDMQACELTPAFSVGMAEEGVGVQGKESRSDYHASILVGDALREMEDGHSESNDTYLSTKVLKNTRMTSPDHFQDVRLVRLEMPQPCLFEPGDSIAVWPTQCRSSIDYVLNRCHLQYDDIVSVMPPSSSSALSASREPVIAKAGHIVQGFVDIRGAAPRRTFLQALGQLCHPEEKSIKERLAYLSAAQGREAFHEYIVQEGRNLVEVLQDFPTIPITLDWILSFGPKLRPRYYSAASSSKEHHAFVDLLVALVEWKTPGRHLRRGLCSRMISSLTEQNEVVIQIQQSDFKPPSSPETPMILVGPGTGVAPFRSFLQERHYHHVQERGVPCCPSLLVFGCRDRSKDYYFKDEWESLPTAVMSDVIVAPSREEPSKKVYVQHVLRTHADRIWKLLCQGATVYVAGRAGTMPSQVEKSFMDIIRTQGGLEPNEAARYLKSMQARKAYQVECWT
ncbi:hypothetical protein M9435_005578 [Picochlorum sp. BPE23]|nr:hypothetical protein M9435_005578 [Picochlorum sp. BPE23]